jgi:hypothetical protein
MKEIEGWYINISFYLITFDMPSGGLMFISKEMSANVYCFAIKTKIKISHLVYYSFQRS